MIQVRLLRNSALSLLEKETNKFLLSNEIDDSIIIDIKFSYAESHYLCMVIYEELSELTDDEKSNMDIGTHYEA